VGIINQLNDDVMKKSFLIAAIAVVVLSFASCCNKADSSLFLGKTIVAETLYGDTIVKGDTHKKASLKFIVEENRLAGNTGCNRIMGSYTIDGDKITFGETGSTRMMCDPESMKTEDKMLKLLNEANRFSTKNSKVTFYNGNAVLGVFVICDKATCCKEKSKCCAEKEKCCKDKAAYAGEKKCCKDSTSVNAYKCHKDSAVCVKGEKKCCKKDSTVCHKGEKKCDKKGEKKCDKKHDKDGHKKHDVK
jgi:heat shock protein HslJ